MSRDIKKLNSKYLMATYEAEVNFRNKDIIMALEKCDGDGNEFFVDKEEVMRYQVCRLSTIEEELQENDLLLLHLTFIALDLPYSNDMAVNKLIATNLLLKMREEKNGSDRVQQAGKYAGRKTLITAEVQDLKETKNLSSTQIAKVTGRGRNTIYKILKQELNYIPYNRLVKPEKINGPK